MQPFQFEVPASTSPTSRPRRELPGYIKGMLMLKLLACLVTLGISTLFLLEGSDPANAQVMTIAPEAAHRLAMYAMVASGISLVELLGVAGTWSFKRWGVYVLGGFSMLNFVVRWHAMDTFGAIISVTTTAIAAMLVASRWEDFE
jgi:ABC-type branched-subunit amino acid transport system permease subunit